ncbi:MAG: single-stranded DNA-binding protein [bacterium]|nr:single-stranded DNA-binding protein [bacterium]
MTEHLRIPDLNKVILVGRLTRDIEIRYTPSKQAVVNFSIAVNRNYQDKNTGEWKNEASFISVVAWGLTAERLAEKTRKGTPLSVEGRLQSRRWETQSGEKRSILEVVADRTQILSYIVQDNTQAEGPAKTTNTQHNQAWNEAKVEVTEEATEEDIPF